MRSARWLAIAGLVASSLVVPVAYGTAQISTEVSITIHDQTQNGEPTHTASTADGDRVDITTDGRVLELFAQAPDGSSKFAIRLSAPGGRELARGRYVAATSEFGEAIVNPVMNVNVFENGGCASLGEFEIMDIVIDGPDNTLLPVGPSYLERLDATFEQRCLDSTPAYYGEIHIRNAIAPAPLGIEFTPQASGTVKNDVATLNGSMDCTKSATVFLSGTAHQAKGARVARGTIGALAECSPDRPVPVSMDIAQIGAEAFRAGKYRIDVLLSAGDPDRDFGAVVVTGSHELLLVGG